MKSKWAPTGFVLLAVAVPVIANVVLILVVGNAARHAHHDAQTVAAVEGLVERALLMRSTELSSICFRLRLPGGHDAPLTGPLAQLACRSVDGWNHIGTVVTTPVGTIDFGFHPPGSYRLILEMVDGMRLEHVFDVPRGSHHDRLIICPNLSSQTARLQVAVQWPNGAMMEDVIAVCRIEPAVFVDGEWQWQPNERWRPVLAVPEHPNATSSTGRLTRFLDVGALFASCDADIHPADDVIIPYRYCRLTEITFLRRPVGDGRERPDIWGTVSFCERRSDADESARHWRADLPAPEFDSLRDPSGKWVIELPESIVDGLLELMQKTTKPPAPSTKAGAATHSPVIHTPSLRRSISRINYLSDHSAS